MKIKPFAILTSAAALLAAAPLAHAESFFQIEAGAGATNYTHSDGKWFQYGAQNNHVQSFSPALTLGLTGNVLSRSHWGIDWHADLNYFGSVSASCQCTISDDDYSTHTQTVRAGAITESYYGSGHAVGVSLMLEPYVTYAGWKVGAAAGVLGYRKTWTEDVSGWPGNFGNPQAVPVHLESEHRVRFAPAIGVDISHKQFTLSYRYFRTSRTEGNVPPLWDNIQTLQLQYRF